MRVASISELKDCLSAHLEAVRSGEVVVVTDRKLPIATLERIHPGTLTDTEKQMISEGTIAPRRQPLDVDALLSMPIGTSPASLVSAILEERSDSR